MINIERISNESFVKTIDFLRSVPSIENIDEGILNNACLALEDDKIVGCISYEEFNEKARKRCSYKQFFKQLTKKN